MIDVPGLGYLLFCTRRQTLGESWRVVVDIADIALEPTHRRPVKPDDERFPGCFESSPECVKRTESELALQPLPKRRYKNDRHRQGKDATDRDFP